MKRKYLLLLFVLLPVFSFAELQIKIGNDTTFCSSSFWQGNPPQLGTDLIITGGVPPYKYAWSATINTYGYYSYATDYLNDTTISTPTFKQDWGYQSWETFTLTVTDAENHTVTDMIKVRFSVFISLNSYVVHYKNIGDEIILSNIPIAGGIEPYRSYEWSPADDLLTPYEKTTVCRITKSANYYVTIVDSVGCEAMTSSDIVMVPLTDGIETEYSNSDIPFIKDGILFWENPEKLPVKINLYSLNGAKIKEVYLVTDEYSLKNNVSVPVVYEIIIGTKRHTGKYMFN